MENENRTQGSPADDIETYSCMACQYVGSGKGPEYCQKCGEEFPPPGPSGETIPCKSCGGSEYACSCPKCGAREEFGTLDTDPRSKEAQTGAPYQPFGSDAKAPPLDHPMRPIWDDAAAITRRTSGDVCMLANRILDRVAANVQEAGAQAVDLGVWAEAMNGATLAHRRIAERLVNHPTFAEDMATMHRHLMALSTMAPSGEPSSGAQAVDLEADTRVFERIGLLEDFIDGAAAKLRGDDKGPILTDGNCENARIHLRKISAWARLRCQGNPQGTEEAKGRDWFLMDLAGSKYAYPVPQYNDRIGRDMISGQIHVREVAGSPLVVPKLCKCGHSGGAHSYGERSYCKACKCEAWEPVEGQGAGLDVEGQQDG